MRVEAALAVLAAGASAQSYAPCPNLCSGHGHCKNADRVCEVRASAWARGPARGARARARTFVRP